MIKNIVFDIGNVLSGFIWEDFYKSFGFSEDIFERLAAATVRNRLWYELDQGTMSTEEIIRGFKEFDPSIEKEIDMVFADVKGMVSRYDYAGPWIEELKKRGYMIYIISNVSEKVVQDCKEALTFLDMVDGAVLSYQEKVQKPDKEIYRIFLERYDLNPQECLFLDDQERNIEAAAELGIRGIVFRNQVQAREEIEKNVNASHNA